MEDPLREDWNAVEAEVRRLVGEGEVPAARRAVRAFHARLCSTRILDPACGTGNFLLGALEVLRRIEAEVLARLDSLGGGEHALTTAPIHTGRLRPIRLLPPGPLPLSRNSFPLAPFLAGEQGGT